LKFYFFFFKKKKKNNHFRLTAGSGFLRPSPVLVFSLKFKQTKKTTVSGSRPAPASSGRLRQWFFYIFFLQSFPAPGRLRRLLAGSGIGF